MDYSTVHRLIEVNGYKKVATKGALTTFSTNYLKNNDRINIEWIMGGYVREIVLTSASGEKIVFENAEQFIETFIN
jgi:hypothetical protein